MNIKDHSYYKYGTEGLELEKIFPKNALVSLKEINLKPYLSTRKRYFNIENLQQQALESINLRKVVKEQSDKTIKYFERKKNVKKEDINLLKKVKKK